MLCAALPSLMVISVHVGHGLKGFESVLTTVYSYGGLGVQLFFVASALTLCMSLQKSLFSPNWLIRYAVRRYFRIAPMYYLGVLIYFAWSFPKNYIQLGEISASPQYTVFNVLSNLLFFHGFVPEAYNNIVPGGWSIAVETTFYLLFPLIFIAYSKYENHRLAITFALIAATLCVISAVQIIMGKTTSENSFLYFNIANQLQVFIIGIYGYYSLASLKKLDNRLLIAVGFALWGVGGSIEGATVFNARFFSLVAYSGAFVMLAALFAKNTPKCEILGEIGRRSFSMYVLHFFILNIVEYLFNVRFSVLTHHLTLKAIFHLLVATSVVYLISGLTKRHVEDRFIRLGAKVFKKYV